MTAGPPISYTTSAKNKPFLGNKRLSAVSYFPFS